MKTPKRYLILLSWLAIVSCGKIEPQGDIKSQDREVAPFSELHLKGKYRLFFVPSQKNFINIETYDNLANNLEIKVKGNALNITENRPTGAVDFYTVTVYSKTPLQKTTIADSVEMNVSGKIKTPEFKLSLQDYGKFIGAVDTPNATVEMHQKSKANFLGKTKEAHLKIADTASIVAPYWAVDYLNLEAQNGSYTEVTAQEEISGKIQNTAQLLYYGNPRRNLKIGDKTQVENKPKP